MAVERVDWDSLIGATLLLTLAIVVLRVLWFWLIILLVFGPPAYAGIVVGHFAGAIARDIGVGLLVAVVVTGLLSELARGAVRACVWSLRLRTLSRGA
jgi:hypothetical protein